MFSIRFTLFSAPRFFFRFNKNVKWISSVFVQNCSDNYLFFFKTGSESLEKHLLSGTSMA